MKTIRSIIELQQSGDDESKSLVMLWSPSTVGQTARLKIFVESHLDGSFGVTRTAMGEFIVYYDGTAAQPVSIDAVSTYSGSPSWTIDPAVDDLSFGGAGGVLVVGVTYQPGGSLTVNFNIDAELTELTG